MSQSPVLKTLSRFAQTVRLNAARLRGTPAAKATGEAEAAVAEAIRVYQAERRALIQSAQSGADLVGPWEEIEALQQKLEKKNFLSARQVLTKVLLNDVDAKMDGKLRANAKVEEALRARGAVETQRIADAFERIRYALTSELFNAGTTLTTRLYAAFDKDFAERMIWRQAFRRGLIAEKSELDLSPPFEATKAGAHALVAEIDAAYAAQMRVAEAAFERDEAPGLRTGILRNRYEAPLVVPLFRDGQRFLRSEVEPTYLETKTHRVDKMINGVVTVVDPDGSVWLQSRSFEDGGTFPFERAWMTVNPKLEQQLRDAKRVDRDAAYIASRRTDPVKRLYFVDQIALTQSARKNLHADKRLELSGTSDEIKNNLAQFVTMMRGADRTQMELSIFAFEGMDDYTGLDNVIAWLEASPERNISVHVDEEGLVYVVVQLHKSVKDIKTMMRTELNDARLMALFVVALADRAVNGAGMQRIYPQILRSEERKIEIPDQCVWPLQVKPKGRGATSRISTATGLAAALAETPAEDDTFEPAAAAAGGRG